MIFPDCSAWTKPYFNSSFTYFKFVVNSVDIHTCTKSILQPMFVRIFLFRFYFVWFFCFSQLVDRFFVRFGLNVSAACHAMKELSGPMLCVATQKLKFIRAYIFHHHHYRFATIMIIVVSISCCSHATDPRTSILDPRSPVPHPSEKGQPP